MTWRLRQRSQLGLAAVKVSKVKTDSSKIEYTISTADASGSRQVFYDQGPFHRRFIPGRLTISLCDARFSEVTPDFTDVRWKGNYGGYTSITLSGSLFRGVVPSVPPGLTPSVDTAMLAQRALSKVGQGFQGGVVVAELHKTAQLIIQPAKQLVGLAKKLQKVIKKNKKQKLDTPMKKRKLRKKKPAPSASEASRSSKDYAKDTVGALQPLANGLLAYNFGVLPLLMDIEDGISAFTKIAVKHATALESVRATQYAETISYPSGTIRTDLIDAKWTGTNTTVAKTTAIVYYYKNMLHYETYGGGVKDIAATAWELTPWSFLVDRVVNIGQWIGSISARRGIDLAAVVCTTTSTNTRLSQFISANFAGLTAKADISGSPYSAVTKSMIRYIGDDPGWLPDVDWAVFSSLKRTLEASALATQQAGRLLRKI